MLSRRNNMMNRVSKKFARVPGQHGDAFAPAFYPVAINPGWWGQPFAKVDSKSQIFFGACIFFPIAYYYVLDCFMFGRCRTGQIGKRALPQAFFWKWSDIDDPDYAIKYNELQKEYSENKLDTCHGGTNFLASYLWQPGDPEPDIRRKEAPAHH